MNKGVALILDQSSTTVGYAVVDETSPIEVAYGVQGKLIDDGLIKTPAIYAAGRVRVIETDVKNLVLSYAPEYMVLEFNKFGKQKSLAGNEALSAVNLTLQGIAQRYKIKVFYINPNHVKSQVAGWTSKSQTDKKEAMINAARQWWGPKKLIYDHNHADALCQAVYWLAHGKEVRRKAAEKKAAKQVKQTKLAGIAGK